MYIATIVIKIEQYIKKIEGALNYEGWNVVLSYKQFAQFTFDTMIPMKYPFEIDEIDMEYYDELIDVLRSLGLNVHIEPQPMIIYLYKSI